MLVDFDMISDSSRVWIYASEVKLNQDNQDYILKKLFLLSASQPIPQMPSVG